MKKMLFFPFTSKDIPFVRYFSSLQSEYILAHTCALSGVALIGHDISYADNREHIGFTVEAFSDDLLNDSDALLISDSATKYNYEKIYMIIEKAIASKKEVFCYAGIPQEQQKKLKDLSDKAKTKLLFFVSSNMWLNTFSNSVLNRQVNKILVPIVFVYGVIEEGNQQEILLGLVAQLKSKGLIISAIGENKILDFFNLYSYKDILSLPSPSERMIAINSLAKNIEELDNPDILLIQVPGNAIKYNDKYPGDFGSSLFEFSQAVLPDYSICSIMCEHYNQAFFEMLSTELSSCFKITLNCIHVSNKIGNMSTSSEKGKLCFYNISQDEAVQMTITLNDECDFSIHHLLREKDLVEVSSSIISKFSS